MAELRISYQFCYQPPVSEIIKLLFHFPISTDTPDILLKQKTLPMCPRKVF